MKTIKKLLLGLSVLLSLPAFAQFTLDGEIRPRFEYRNGFKNILDSTQSPAAFVDQRTRLYFGYKTDGYIFKVTVQDIRVWGSQPQTIGTAAQQNNNGAYIAVHEAWVEALLNEKWSLKFGRQEIAYDDHRIFGDLGWAQQSRAHDAALLKFKNEKTKVDFGVAYNQDKAALSGTDAQFGTYKAMQYMWLNHKLSDNFNASVLFLNLGKEQLDYDSSGVAPGTATAYYKDNYSQTAGTRLVYKKDKFQLAGAFYYQMGVDGNRNTVFTDVKGEYNREIQAINVRLEANYKMSEKFAVHAGFEHLSGQSQTDTSFSYRTVNHSFTPHFGTNHKFNGYMDYFYVGNHINSVGLNDAFFGLKYTHKKFWLGADVHYFLAAEEVLDGYKIQLDNNAAIAAGTPLSEVDQLQAMDSYLGTEIDFTLGFKLSKGVDVKGGYSVMINTETLSYLKGVTDANGRGIEGTHNGWGWLMLTIKPKFITGEEKKETPTVN